MLWRSIFKHFGIPKFAKTYFLSKTNLFWTNYAKPLRQAWVILLHRIYLKHRNSISKFWKDRFLFALDFGNKRRSVLSMLPCGRPFFEKSSFLFNKRRSVLLMLPCGRPFLLKKMCFSLFFMVIKLFRFNVHLPYLRIPASATAAVFLVADRCLWLAFVTYHVRSQQI